jgi:hypothetical protein
MTGRETVNNARARLIGRTDRGQGLAGKVKNLKAYCLVKLWWSAVAVDDTTKATSRTAGCSPPNGNQRVISTHQANAP